MSTTDTEDFDQLETVQFGAEGAAEMDRHRRVIFVPREQIVRLELEYGSGAEHPLVVGVLGAVCAVTAVVLVITFALVVMRGRVRMPESLITGVAFLIPGWWLLDLAIRKRWFVRVHTPSGTRKLVFRQTKDERELHELVAKGRRRYGCV